MYSEDKIYSKVPPDLQQIAKVVKLMDSSIKIPGTNRTFGIEPLIGLIPVLGDVIDFGISAWIMMVLLKNNASGRVIAKMLVNVGLDALLMLIPVLGNIIDFFYKANQRNLILALEHYEEGKHQGSAWPVLLPIIGTLMLMLALITAGTIWIFITIWNWIM
jgi:Domain of unknown function (DUF4112)